MSSSPPSAVAARFALIIDGLCRAVWASYARGIAGPLIVLIHNRLRRIGDRFAVLAAHIQAGTLPAARPRRGGVTRDAASASPRPPPLLPRGYGWLLRLVPGVALHGAQLHYLVADPEMAALLAFTPRAGRLVRPLLGMLGWEIPAGSPLTPARRTRARPIRDGRQTGPAPSPGPSPGLSPGPSPGPTLPRASDRTDRAGPANGGRLIPA